MNIKDIKGYDEFKKHCNFELCTKRYPDWIGSEKYIVITDDAEKDLLEAFPEIMKELSPYVIVGRYFAKMNDDMRYNDSKSAASSFSLDQIDDYENLSEGFVAPDFSEDLCNKDAIITGRCLRRQRGRKRQGRIESHRQKEATRATYIGAHIPRTENCWLTRSRKTNTMRMKICTDRYSSGRPDTRKYCGKRTAQMQRSFSSADT